MPIGIEPRIWRQCSFAEWASLCNMMDEWDNTLRNVPYCDWTIHRKLGEAAGLAHRYIIPTRGSGKSMFVDSFDDPKKIFRKHRKDHKPQEFVTIKDGDVEKWLQQELNRDVIERILSIFKADERRVITSHNPYWDYKPYIWFDSWGERMYRAEKRMNRYVLDEDVKG